MKKYTAGLAAIGAAFASGSMFLALDATAYTSMGVQSGYKPLNIAVSLVFCLLFFAAAVFCGRRHMSGVLVGGAAALTLFAVVGFMCYFGLSVAVGDMTAVFYIISAPFMPITEGITLLLGLYDYADLTMLLIPVLIYFAAFAAYFAGAGMKSEPMLVLKRTARREEHMHSEQLSA